MLHVLVQFSTSFDAEINPVLKHLLKVYKKNGYPGDEHYLEIPTWATWISGILRSYRGVRSAPHFVLLKDWNDIYSTQIFYGEYTIVHGSVLDANRDLWLDFIQSSPLEWQFELGGYVSEEDQQIFEDHERVRWFNSIFEFANKYIGEKQEIVPDYSLFAGQEVIPRLQMSTGCEHACSFCTIPREVYPVPVSVVYSQVAAWKDLKFKYVYLDDKTFGQADNYKDIEFYGRAIREYNPDFLGFVIQTTVPMLWERYDEFLSLGVVIAEIGVEVPDDKFLKKMRKPYRMDKLDSLMRVQAQYMGSKRLDHIKIVPNILLGVPGDDYKATIGWLTSNINLIAWTNPFILSYYEEAKAPDALADRGHSEGDDDENNYSSRSWLVESEVNGLEKTLDHLFWLVEQEN